MPCRDDYGDERRHEEAKRLDLVTRLLCEANTILDRYANVGESRSPTMLKWWSGHQEIDRKRLAKERVAAEQERIRKAALRKLTPVEQRALGL